MQNTNTYLDSKSISRLSSKGLSPIVLKNQIRDSLDITLDNWSANGLRLTKRKGYFFFETKFISLQDAEFCIVDIETNGSKLERHQIIEIAALRIKNFKIVDIFESLVKCDEINKHITQITGISIKDTIYAPSLKNTLIEFKKFLGSAIFVAHDVKFDYNFISGSMQNLGIQPLLNRKLCSLELAERTIVSFRYALSYLSQTFKLNTNAVHHRAMSDVETTFELFKLSFSSIKENINNIEDLIKFSKEAPRLKRPKFDPFIKKD